VSLYFIAGVLGGVFRFGFGIGGYIFGYDFDDGFFGRLKACPTWLRHGMLGVGVRLVCGGWLGLWFSLFCCVPLDLWFRVLCCGRQRLGFRLLRYG
jgi:hypothetical protein